MIPVRRVPEPQGFDSEVRQRGGRWLAETPAPTRPRPLWVPFTSHLAEGFSHLCGYTAMHLEDGTVDHYLPCVTHRHLAYEWSNYRYASPRINGHKHKQGSSILDPFEVGDDWFEIILPSLQMRATTQVPLAERERVAFTLKRLRLQHDEKIIKIRKGWYDGFLNGGLTLRGLEENAPLIARAVTQRLDRLESSLSADGHAAFRRLRTSEISLPGLRREAPQVGSVIDAELKKPS